jgi:hypothetical protein
MATERALHGHLSALHLDGLADTISEINVMGVPKREQASGAYAGLVDIESGVFA